MEARKSKVCNDRPKITRFNNQRRSQELPIEHQYAEPEDQHHGETGEKRSDHIVNLPPVFSPFLIVAHIPVQIRAGQQYYLTSKKYPYYLNAHFIDKDGKILPRSRF